MSLSVKSKIRYVATSAVLLFVRHKIFKAHLVATENKDTTSHCTLTFKLDYAKLHGQTCTVQLRSMYEDLK